MSDKLPELQIPEFMSLSECREAIALHANNINSEEEIMKDEAEALNHIAYEDVCNVDNPRFPENEVYMDKYRFWRGVAGERHFDPYYDPRN